MKNFETIDDILDFAINEEENAVEFYNSLSAKANNDDMRKMFIEFAHEEMSHKARLIKIKQEKQFTLSNEKVLDLHIADYIVNIPATSGTLTYQEALVVAMKKEKAAYKLYVNLADKTDNPGLKQVFLSLALEESKHKLRFELEYDEYILREN